MPLDFYYAATSAPCRAVLLTAEAIGISLNLIPINLAIGERLKPEVEQINPQKTVPFLVDDDYNLSESRAIMAYLTDQYGKNPRLYPQTLMARALVNQRLNFDIGTMYRGLKYYYYPVMFYGASEYDEKYYKLLEHSFDVLNTFLDGQDYVAGRNMTIADLSMVATVSTIEAFGFDIQDYPNVVRWFEKIKSSAPGYRTANGEGIQMLKYLAESKK